MKVSDYMEIIKECNDTTFNLNEKNKLKEIIKNYYLEYEKSYLIKKANESYLNDKTLDNMLNIILNNFKSEEFLTYVVKKDDEIKGLLRVCRDKTEKDNSSFISIIKLELTSKEIDEVLNEMTEDVISYWEPQIVTTFVSALDKNLNAYLDNGFYAYEINKNLYLIEKDMREKKYVRTRKNNTNR